MQCLLRLNQNPQVKETRGMKSIYDYHDCDVFKPGEVWMSPRGYFWKVIESVPNGQALLRLGKDGHGRISRRRWDHVCNWIRDTAAPSSGTH